MKNTRSPLGKALLESRYIVLGAILVAVAYNVFAESRVPWIRELPGSGTTVNLDSLLGAGATTPIDTAAAPIDTATAIDTAAAIDSTLDPAALAQAKKDSLARVAADAKRVQDSIAAAKARAATPEKPAELAADALEVSTPQAKQIYDRKIATWFDARPATEFAEGHIPGAHNIYANDFQQHIPQILQMNLPKEKLIVVYCGGGLCELSHDLAKNIRLLGFTKVVVYTGGTGEWTKNNYPMTKGE